MMKKLFPLLLVLTLCVVIGCSSDSENDNLLVAISKTGCKNIAGTSTRGAWDEIYGEESVKYNSTDDGCLMINHLNALFACDANIIVSATMEKGIICIIEEGGNSTNCICPYDLNMKVGPLSPGKYTVKIYQQHSSSFAKEEHLSFDIEYPLIHSGVVTCNH